MRKCVFAGIALLALSGCAASGVEVKQSQVDQFKVGQSKYDDVVQKLGSPTSSTIMSDGSKQITYIYIKASARPESFIPIVGMFAGGADSHMTDTVFYFNKDGVLTNYGSTTSKTGVGTGLEAGKAEPRTAQPRAAN